MSPLSLLTPLGIYLLNQTRTPMLGSPPTNNFATIMKPRWRKRKRRKRDLSVCWVTFIPHSFFFFCRWGGGQFIVTPVLLPAAECLISPLSERSMGRSACDASRVCRRGDKGRHTSSPRRVGGRWKKGAEVTEGTQRAKKRKAELRELHPEKIYI